MARRFTKLGHEEPCAPQLNSPEKHASKLQRNLFPSAKGGRQTTALGWRLNNSFSYRGKEMVSSN